MSSTTCPSSSSFTVTTRDPGEPAMIITHPAIPTVARMGLPAPIRPRNRQTRWSEAEPLWIVDRGFWWGKGSSVVVGDQGSLDGRADHPVVPDDRVEGGQPLND